MLCTHAVFHTQDCTTRNSHVCAVQLSPLSGGCVGPQVLLSLLPRRAPPVTSVSLLVSSRFFSHLTCFLESVERFYVAELPEEVNYLWVFDVEAQFDINSLMVSA